MKYLLKIIENIGIHNTNRKDFDSLKSLNISVLINLFYTVQLISYFIVNEINFGTTLLVSLLLLFTPLIFFFNNLGYRKTINVLFILLEITIISFLHISIYVVEIFSTSFILFILSILLQVILVINHIKGRNAFFIFLFFLMLSIGFIFMKYHYQHQIKIFQSESVFFIEFSTLFFATLLITYHIYLLSKKHDKVNLYFQTYMKKINKKVSLLEGKISETTSKISKIQKLINNNAEINRITSIHDKVQSLLLHDTTTLLTKAEIFDITSRYIMSIFNAKHIALYELSKEMNDKFHLRCLYLYNIKKHSSINIFSSLYLQDIQFRNKEIIIIDFASRINIGGLENNITANQLLFIPINLEKTKYMLICHSPTINNIEEFKDLYKKDILFIIETMQLKIESLNTKAKKDKYPI